MLFGTGNDDDGVCDGDEDGDGACDRDDVVFGVGVGSWVYFLGWRGVFAFMQSSLYTLVRLDLVILECRLWRAISLVIGL